MIIPLARRKREEVSQIELRPYLSLRNQILVCTTTRRTEEAMWKRGGGIPGERRRTREEERWS